MTCLLVNVFVCLLVAFFAACFLCVYICLLLPLFLPTSLCLFVFHTRDEEDSRLREGNRHLHLAYDEEEEDTRDYVDLNIRVTVSVSIVFTNI